MTGTAGDPPAEPLKDWYSRGYLPHLDRAGKTQFVTFRLHDSMPISLLEVWRAEMKELEEADRSREENIRIMRYLDAGTGECYLARPDIARMVEETLLYFHGDRYDLLAWVVMPNHVHTLVRLSDGNSLPKVVHSWKSYTAHAANRQLGRTGPFWYREFYDRYIRDEEHYGHVLRYIEHNPVKARLCERAEEFAYGSARLKVGSDQ